METTSETKRGKGRPKGTTNRDKSTIEQEKTEKERRTLARKNLGLPTRGRLNKQDQEKLDEYLK